MASLLTAREHSDSPRLQEAAPRGTIGLDFGLGSSSGTLASVRQGLLRAVTVIFALAWALVGGVLWAAEVEIRHPVTDPAEVLSPGEEESIARTLVQHRERTGVQLAVVVLSTTDGEPIEDFSQRVFTQWGGGSAERDDGALFVLAIADRRSRLHLGYGLEPLISDATAKEMLDDLRPALQDGRYGDATAQLVDAFCRRTAHLQPNGAIDLPRGATGWLWPVVMAMGVTIGIAWGWANRGLKLRNFRLRALRRSVRGRVALGMLAFSQLAIIVLFWEGSGFWWAYSLLFWLFWGAGWLTARGGVWGILIGMGTCPGLIAAMSTTDPSAVLADGIGVLAEASPALAAFAVLTGIFAFFGLLAKLGVGSDSSGSSYASTSSSYASSYGSSYSSSSSYASSSYSGGGGSSGGGGASSSW